MKLYGKSGLKQRLDGIAAKGRLSHAVLFSGHSGIGKKKLARYTAELFMCGHGACGACATCRRIENDTHPDVIFVKRRCGDKYAIDPFRDVLSDTVVRPNDGDVKVYVFEECDTMNLTCHNTLLKLIEEPADYLRFVFTCESTSVIPETVLSRVTEFEVPDPSVKDCEQALLDCGADKVKARELSEMFAGNIGECKAVLEGGDEAAFIETARKAAAALGAKDGFSLAAALSEGKKRADFSRVMDYLTRMIRDALAIRSGCDAEFFGKKESAAIAASFSEEEILNMLDAAFELSKNEIYNLNLALSQTYFVSRALGG